MEIREEACRLQIRKILDSREFSMAPQVRQFLAYIAEAAFQNRDRLDQVEIAEQVLGKGHDFNPVDDASVRRIATLTRQKIQKYYSGAGREDPVLVQLPVRSYIPVFQAREPRPRRRWWPAAAAALALAGAAAAVGYVAFRRQPAARTGEVEIVTRRGSIESKALDVPGSAILLGPRLGSHEDLSVRLRFTPEQVYQQAGLMVYQNPDQYVKLGRQFSGRTYLEFGMETRGIYPRPPGTWTYDPLGQNARPVWLMIRRRGNVFRGFVSADGDTWRQVGNTLEMPDPMEEARAGIYGYNGQADAAPARARFQDLGTGLTFTGPPDQPPEGWITDSNCQEPSTAKVIANMLEFRFPPRPCIWSFVRAAPAGDWAITTKLDLQPFSGTVAGLIVRGRKARLRLVRWALNGGSIAAEYPPGNQVKTAPDFPGSPPVVLRLESKRGIITGSFSRDEVQFTPLEASMRQEDLGAGVQFGLTAQLTSWSQVEALPAPRFFYIRQEITNLTHFR